MDGTKYILPCCTFIHDTLRIVRKVTHEHTAYLQDKDVYLVDQTNKFKTTKETASIVCRGCGNSFDVFFDRRSIAKVLEKNKIN